MRCRHRSTALKEFLEILFFAIIPTTVVSVNPSESGVDLNEAFVRRAAVSAKKSRSSTAANRPHIIFILADDLGWNDVSFHGSRQIPTPNIDTLAAAGIVLNNYYVTPLCTPSRSALMTGKYPIHLGMQHDVIDMNEPWGVPLNVKLLPQYLKKLGYRRHIVGKWHLGAHKAVFTPLHRGFETHLGYWGGYQDYFNHSSDLNFMGETLKGHDMRRNMDPLYELKGQYATQIYTEEARNLIRQHDPKEPLFLYVAHLAVHSGWVEDPLQAPPEVVEKFSHIGDPRRRAYAAMVHELDKSVGAIVKSLEDKGMLENSIIVFSTDNGGAAGGINLNAASNWPLKGTKYTAWEGGVRGVGLIWSRRLQGSGQVMFNHLMHMVDWLPTLYSAAGGKPSDLKKIDGINMWPALTRRTFVSPRNEVLLDLDPIWRKAAIRVGKWKLINGTLAGGHYDNWFGPTGDEDEPDFYLRSYSMKWDTIDNDESGTVQKSKQLKKQASKTFSPSANNDLSFLAPNDYAFWLDLHLKKGKVAGKKRRSRRNAVYIPGFDFTEDGTDHRITRTRSVKYETSADGGKSVLYPILNVTALFSKQRRRFLSRLGVSRVGSASRKKDFFTFRTSLDCGERPATRDLRTKFKCSPAKRPCLFDLSEDPCEFKNVAAQNPDVVRRLWERLNKYEASAVPPRNQNGDPAANPKNWGNLWTNWKDFVKPNVTTQVQVKAKPTTPATKRRVDSNTKKSG